MKNNIQKKRKKRRENSALSLSVRIEIFTLAFSNLQLRQMAVVLQTKPNIHMLLAIPDYVAALDLIHTTQDLLSQELAGIHSFRNLNSELNEMLFLIDNLMAGEFQKYATTDLNRPLLDSQANILEGVSLIFVFSLLPFLLFVFNEDLLFQFNLTFKLFFLEILFDRKV